MQYQVSVIIPTVGRIDSLKRAVNSIFNQTVTAFEIIIVNDGCRNTVKNYYRELDDDRVRLINGNYGSGAKSRNIGIKSSSGKYITFLDDDDEFATTKIAKQVSILESNDYDVVLCGSKCINSVCEKKLPINHSISLELKRANPYNITLMCNSNILKKNLMDENLENYQDWDLLVRFVKLECKIKYLPESLYIIDDGDHQRITNTIGIENDEIDCRLRAIVKHRTWLGEKYFKYRCFKEELSYIRKRPNRTKIVSKAISKYGVYSLLLYIKYHLLKL